MHPASRPGGFEVSNRRRLRRSSAGCRWTAGRVSAPVMRGNRLALPRNTLLLGGGAPPLDDVRRGPEAVFDHLAVGLLALAVQPLRVLERHGENPLGVTALQ